MNLPKKPCFLLRHAPGVNNFPSIIIRTPGVGRGVFEDISCYVPLHTTRDSPKQELKQDGEVFPKDGHPEIGLLQPPPHGLVVQNIPSESPKKQQAGKGAPDPILQHPIKVGMFFTVSIAV